MSGTVLTLIYTSSWQAQGQHYLRNSHECCSSGLPFTWAPVSKIWQQCTTCVISGFHCKVAENCTPLDYYTVSSGTNISGQPIAPILRVQDSRRTDRLTRNVGNYHYSLCNNAKRCVCVSFYLIPGHITAQHSTINNKITITSNILVNKANLVVFFSAPSSLYLQDYTRVHGQQNIKFYKHIPCTLMDPFRTAFKWQATEFYYHALSWST